MSKKRHLLISILLIVLVLVLLFAGIRIFVFSHITIPSGLYFPVEEYLISAIEVFKDGTLAISTISEDDGLLCGYYFMCDYTILADYPIIAPVHYQSSTNTIVQYDRNPKDTYGKVTLQPIYYTRIFRADDGMFSQPITLDLVIRENSLELAGRAYTLCNTPAGKVVYDMFLENVKQLGETTYVHQYDY